MIPVTTDLAGYQTKVEQAIDVVIASVLDRMSPEWRHRVDLPRKTRRSA
jgi:hypothetical protein